VATKGRIAGEELKQPLLRRNTGELDLRREWFSRNPRRRHNSARKGKKRRQSITRLRGRKKESSQGRLTWGSPVEEERKGAPCGVLMEGGRGKGTGEKRWRSQNESNLRGQTIAMSKYLI